MSKLTLEQALAWVLDTVVQNRAKNCNPYSRPGVKQALALLNELAGGPCTDWGSSDWKAYIPDEHYADGVSVRTDDQLYIVEPGSSSECYYYLGFDYCEKQTKGLAQEMGRSDLMPEPEDRGTIAGFVKYRKAQAAAARYSDEHKYQFSVGLVPQLIGLEGKRVEVVEHNGDVRRFWVGKSTGWCPTHLEISRKGASGGGGVTGAPFLKVRVIPEKGGKK